LLRERKFERKESVGLTKRRLLRGAVPREAETKGRGRKEEQEGRLRREKRVRGSTSSFPIIFAREGFALRCITIA